MIIPVPIAPHLPRIRDHLVVVTRVPVIFTPPPESRTWQPSIRRPESKKEFESPMTLTPRPKLTDFDDPERVSRVPRPESKKEFESPPESKKIFDPPGESKKEFEPTTPFDDDIEIDREGDEVGRWRAEEQVKELVVYRNEWGVWPTDLEDKSSKETRTGIESYYEIRYFKDGTNSKGVLYAELYAKHRARKRVWLEEDAGAGNAALDAAAVTENLVHFPIRRADSAS